MDFKAKFVMWMKIKISFFVLFGRGWPRCLLVQSKQIQKKRASKKKKKDIILRAESYLTENKKIV